MLGDEGRGGGPQKPAGAGGDCPAGLESGFSPSASRSGSARGLVEPPPGSHGSGLLPPLLPPADRTRKTKQHIK